MNLITKPRNALSIAGCFMKYCDCIIRVLVLAICLVTITSARGQGNKLEIVEFGSEQELIQSMKSLFALHNQLVGEGEYEKAIAP